MNRIEVLYNHLDELYQEVSKESKQQYLKWESQIERENFKSSAKNLLAYLSLRKHDLRKLQNELSSLGVSSLGRLEGKVLPTIQATTSLLDKINSTNSHYDLPDEQEFYQQLRLLEENTTACYGSLPVNHPTRIMVTLDTLAAKDKAFMKRLIQEGMNVARINCAHDNPEIWSQMIHNIREVEKEMKCQVKVLMDLSGPKIRTEWVFTTLKNPKVISGDLIEITGDFEKLPQNPHVKVTAGCSIVDVYENIDVGDPILIDDGAIEGIIQEVHPLSFVFKVTKVKGKEKRLKSEKGINFPNSDFTMPLLDEQDKKDLQFAIEYADIVGLSFVRNKWDILEVQNYIQNDLGKDLSAVHIMAKIETVQAFQNLGEIIMTAASKQLFSIMIARGDLAVESGYARLAEIQEEILWICEASATPVVWGTEVLANLVNVGVPSRSEITDAAKAIQAEVVMLNKGPFIEQGIRMLSNILSKMQHHSYKKSPRLRSLNIARDSEL